MNPLIRNSNFVMKSMNYKVSLLSPDQLQSGFYRLDHSAAQLSEEERELAQKKESQKIAYWSLGVDVFMTTVKGGVGWLLNSTAIIADISLVLEKVT